MFKPSFIIGPLDNPYLWRWHLLPRNRWFNIYLHKVLRDDDDRALHDHPYDNISVVLKGGYTEVVPHGLRWTADWAHDEHVADGNMAYVAQPPHDRHWRGPGSILFRKAWEPHRLELPMKGDAMNWHKEPSWSLFITFPRKRAWGFWCKRGWVPQTEYVRKTEHGNEIGIGCGE